MTASPEPPVRLGLDRGDMVFLVLACALAGLGMGAATPYVAGWLVDLPWAPFQGPLQLIGSFDSPWALWIRPALGLLLGLALAAYLVEQTPVLHVSAEQIDITHRGTTRRIARADVAGIYREGRDVVVESDGGRHLFHGVIEGSKDTVRDAFVSHGYPWETTA